MILVIGMLVGGCARKKPTSWESIKNPEVVAQLKSFVAEKEAQANASTNKMPKEFKIFFAAANKGDWFTVSNMFFDRRQRLHFRLLISRKPCRHVCAIATTAISLKIQNPQDIGCQT